MAASRKNVKRREAIVSFVSAQGEATAQEVSEHLKTHVNIKSFMSQMEKEGLLTSDTKSRKHPTYGGLIRYKVYRLPS